MNTALLAVTIVTAVVGAFLLSDKLSKLLDKWDDYSERVEKAEAAEAAEAKRAASAAQPRPVTRRDLVVNIILLAAWLAVVTWFIASRAGQFTLKTAVLIIVFALLGIPRFRELYKQVKEYRTTRRRTQNA
jgi:cation transport ATPase